MNRHLAIPPLRGVDNIFYLIKNSGLGSLFLIVLVGLLLSSCSQAKPDSEVVVFAGPIMGTDYQISVVLSKNQLDSERQQILKQTLFDEMQAVNISMSTYLPDSELSQLNNLPREVPFEMSPLLSEVMAEAQRISHLSNGAFDVTLGPAIDLWGFGPQGRISKQPSIDLLNDVRKSVGFQLLEIELNQITKRADKVQISLSAIAKGFAVDRVAQALKQRGHHNFLVNIGGELKGSGHKPDGNVWRVGVEKPQLLGGVQQLVELSNAAIASSGDYRNYHVIDGQQYSHTIDPTTLKPVRHKLAAVSVISTSAMTADALATALMVMGEAEAWRFVQAQELAAYLIVRDPNEGTLSFKISDAFQAYLP